MLDQVQVWRIRRPAPVLQDLIAVQLALDSLLDTLGCSFHLPLVRAVALLRRRVVEHTANPLRQRVLVNKISTATCLPAPSPHELCATSPKKILMCILPYSFPVPLGGLISSYKRSANDYLSSSSGGSNSSSTTSKIYTMNKLGMK